MNKVQKRRKKGLIMQKRIRNREKGTGTVLSGAGFGAAIWVFLAGQLFKYFTWQQCYRIITVIALVFGLIAVLFLIRTPKEFVQLPMPAKEETDTVTDPS